ncbi:MAG: alpha/beta hydrolase [Acidimicrobiales bacterium]
MTGTAGPATCAQHPKRERVASCGSCGDAMCRDCIVPTAVGFKCRTCTGEKAPVAAKERRAPAEPSSPSGRPRWLWPAVAAAVVVVLVGGFVVATSGGGGDTIRYADDDTGDPAERGTPRELQLELNGGSATRIGATLTVPAKAAAATFAVLIVPGFGAIDRDAVMAAANTPDGSADRLSQDLNYSRPGSPDNLPLDLNDAFLAKGASTLRYDKRGSGKSPLPADKALSYDDLLADAWAGAELLAQRVESANAPLVVVGIDQGGLIAMRMAADPRVKAIVLVSTFGRPLADVVGDDFIAKRGDAGKAASDQLHEIATRLAAGQSLPPPAEINSHLRPLLPPTQERYLRSVFGLDPVAEARGVKSRVVLVRGANDTSSTAVDSERLRAVLPPGTQEVVVPDADHNLGTGTRRDPLTMSQLAAQVQAAATG